MMYRLLRAHAEVRERRRQAVHPPRARPELTATAPNAVWSWDITKLKDPRRGDHDLYVILDIFGRYLFGWTVAPTESAELATELIADAVAVQRVEPYTVSIHADRGSSMTSNPVAELLSFLGLGRTHSRPHMRNDNPYSEAQFKTLKYCPAFSDRFGSISDARAFCRAFFVHYNREHRHSGIGYHTAASVHYGTAAETRSRRAAVLDRAYTAPPVRFGHRQPEPPRLPTVDWINSSTPESVQSMTPCLTGLDRLRASLTHTQARRSRSLAILTSEDRRDYQLKRSPGSVAVDIVSPD